MARGLYLASRYFSQRSGGSRICPSASMIMGALLLSSAIAKSHSPGGGATIHDSETARNVCSASRYAVGGWAPAKPARAAVSQSAAGGVLNLHEPRSTASAAALRRTDAALRRGDHAVFDARH